MWTHVTLTRRMSFGDFMWEGRSAIKHFFNVLRTPKLACHRTHCLPRLFVGTVTLNFKGAIRELGPQRVSATKIVDLQFVTDGKASKDKSPATPAVYKSAPTRSAIVSPKPSITPCQSRREYLLRSATW